MELLRKKIIKSLIIITLLLSTEALFSQEKVKVFDLSVKDFEVKNFDKNENNKENNFIYFEQDQENSQIGRVILNVSTLNQDNIQVSWQNCTAKKTKSRWYARLQYRLSMDSEWIDVLNDKGKPIEFVSQTKRYKKDFNNITLSKDCENKALVQISWKVDIYDGKVDPEILFRNISVSSEYDKYFGVPAKVDVALSGDDTNNNISCLTFDNIPLPYTYPESRRIKIKGENIRDSITLTINGENKDCFSVSQSSIKEKYAKNETITIEYAPKKEGHHRAILEINTTKLLNPIDIAIEGSCAKYKSYDKNLLNLLANEKIKGKTSSYRIPVFSNTDYQYRFINNGSNIRILYKWYKDSKLIYTMRDTTKTNVYCVPLKSPATSNCLEISISSDNDISLQDNYFGTPRVKTMIKSGAWSDENNWQPKGEPNIEDVVVIDKYVNAKVDDNVACSMLVLEDSANISINTGKMFYVSSDIFYNKHSYFTVHQYLLPGKWNYISTPINQAHAAIFSMKNDNNETWLMKYNTGIKSQHDDYWSEYLVDPKLVLEPGHGYAVYTHEPLDVKYEGLLCNSSVTVSLTTTPEDKWNLVGNPFTAPLSSKKLYDDIYGKIQGNAIFLFDRENKVYNPLIIDSKEEVMIPSLESFFVEALSYPTDITFKRKHQYIPQTGNQCWVNNNYLNLSVTKGKGVQYVLMGMDERSEYGFDELDCHKMFGNSEDMPDIYLTDNKDEFSVNVFPSYPAIYDIGLYIGNPGKVEINLNNISVLPENVNVFVEDKVNNKFYDFCQDSKVETLLKSGTTEDFRIHIIKAIPINSIDKEYSGIYLWQDKGRILLYGDMIHKLKQVIVKDKNGNTVIQEDYTPYQVMSKALNQGIYKVDLYIDNTWIKDINFKIK